MLSTFACTKGQGSQKPAAGLWHRCFLGLRELPWAARPVGPGVYQGPRFAGASREYLKALGVGLVLEKGVCDEKGHLFTYFLQWGKVSISLPCAAWA